MALSDEAVEVRILKARIEQDAAVGLRMDGLVNLLNEKLDDHSNSLGAEMKSLGERLEGSVNKVLANQAEQEKRFEGRAKMDDDFRLTIKAEVKELRHRLRLISWLLMATKMIKDVVASASIMMENGKGVLSGIAAVCSATSVIWLFFHQMLPYIKTLIHHTGGK